MKGFIFSRQLIKAVWKAIINNKDVKAPEFIYSLYYVCLKRIVFDTNLSLSFLFNRFKVRQFIKLLYFYRIYINRTLRFDLRKIYWNFCRFSGKSIKEKYWCYPEGEHHQKNSKVIIYPAHNLISALSRKLMAFETLFVFLLYVKKGRFWDKLK